MRFEVTNKKEERSGFIIKKPIYLARASIQLNDEEFEALEAMTKTKDWKMYPLGEVPIGDKHRREVTMEMFYSWAKKTKSFDLNIRTPLPEAREMSISEVKEVASTLKQVLEARLSALSTSDEDIAVEI